MICLGIDQSYTQIGISIAQGSSIDDGELLLVRWYNYKGLKDKTQKRRFVAKLIKKLIEKFNPDIIVVERIRLFSQGNVSINYMKCTGALIATIVDASYPKKVYSADTRSWKSRVCGKASGMHAGDKGVSVRYIRIRFDLDLNDDAADAICIALYGLEANKFIKSKLLKKEE